MEDYEVEVESSNSELRYLTLELMKLAYSKGKSFREVAVEFINNVYLLKSLIEKEGEGLTGVEERKESRK